RIGRVLRLRVLRLGLGVLGLLLLLLLRLLRGVRLRLLGVLLLLLALPEPLVVPARVLVVGGSLERSAPHGGRLVVVLLLAPPRPQVVAGVVSGGSARVDETRQLLLRLVAPALQRTRGGAVDGHARRPSASVAARIKSLRLRVLPVAERGVALRPVALAA